MADFSNVADDFFLNLNVQTTLNLPTNRETVLHFVEAVQKEFNEMTSFFQRETGEFVLEGNRDSGSYRWLELHSHRLTAGYFNPPTLADGYHMHTWLLDRSTYFLGMSGLDIECLDVAFGFNLDYQGNRDAIVAQALLANSPLASFIGGGAAKIVECEPNIVISLDDECYLQARLWLETRSNSYQIRTGEYEEEPISVYMTVRRYAQPGTIIKLKESFDLQSKHCEDISTKIVVPQIIQPISAAIASAG